MTLSAVAREVGVSVPTVSKVVNGREDVARSYPRPRPGRPAEDRVQVTPPTQGQPGAQRTVEAVFDSLNSAYNMEVLKGIMEQANVSDMEVILSVTGLQAASPLGPEATCPAHGR